MLRVLIAGVIGGILMYAWTSFVEFQLELGAVGLQGLPHAQSVVTPLKAATGDKLGLYFYPFGGGGAEMSEANMKPNGLILYNPAGTPGVSPAMLGSEFAKELVQALIAAWVASLAVAALFWRRVGIVAAIGFSAAIGTNLSNYIWYFYPLDYTLAQIFIQFSAASVAGLGIAFWLGRSKPA